MAPRIGFIGMGLMGQAITSNLVLKAGLDEPVLLYNRTKRGAIEHCASIGHARVASTLEELVDKSEIIWSCVQDERAVLDIFKEMLKHDVGSKVFVESSTIPAELTDRIARQAADVNAQFVAMPVFGDPSLAKAGKLICVPAGPISAVSRILPYLTGVVAQSVIDLSGEEPGKASLLKLIGNVLIMNTMETVAELMVFGEKTGLGVNNVARLVDAFPKAAGMIYCQKMLSGDYYRKQPMVEVCKARHLTSQVLELAKASNVSLKSYEVAVEHLETVERNAGSNGDITGIYGAVRVESQMPYELDHQDLDE